MKNAEQVRHNIVAVVFLGPRLAIDAHHIAYDDNIVVEQKLHGLFETDASNTILPRVLLTDKIGVTGIFINKSEMFEPSMQKTIRSVLKRFHAFLECDLDDDSDRPKDWPSITGLSNVIVSRFPENIFQHLWMQEGLDTKDVNKDIFYGETARANDPLYPKARAIVLEHRRASLALVQRHFCIGYMHASRLLDAMVGDILTEKNVDGLYSFIE
jgi:DNA segregation ATPase FtsK/SpoIIIE-like protein